MIRLQTPAAIPGGGETHGASPKARQTSQVEDNKFQSELKACLPAAPDPVPRSVDPAGRNTIPAAAEQNAPAVSEESAGQLDTAAKAHATAEGRALREPPSKLPLDTSPAVTPPVSAKDLPGASASKAKKPAKTEVPGENSEPAAPQTDTVAPAQQSSLATGHAEAVQPIPAEGNKTNAAPGMEHVTSPCVAASGKLRHPDKRNATRAEATTIEQAAPPDGPPVPPATAAAGRNLPAQDVKTHLVQATPSTNEALQPLVQPHTVETRHAGAAGVKTSRVVADPTEPLSPQPLVRTYLADTRSLEIGIADATHGWLRVRAQVSPSGEIAASLTAASSGQTEQLRKELPAMSHFLVDERIGVATLEVNPAPVTDGKNSSPGHFEAAAQGEAQKGGEPQSQVQDQSDESHDEPTQALAFADALRSPPPPAMIDYARAGVGAWLNILA